MWKIILLATWASSVFGCGDRPLDDRIVGGKNAKKGEFPWMASLQRLTWAGFHHLCGASLVAPDWLVTAAHCIQLDSASYYRIAVGNNNLSSITPEQQLKIKMIVIKHGFDGATFDNDIALVQLSQPLTKHSTVCLTDRPPRPDGAGRIVGWGATREGGKVSPYLQTADVTIIATEECCNGYYGVAIKSSMVCAANVEEPTDACQGDSGGPLLQFENTKANLVGVVSWGIGCANRHYPGVYTDVFQFVPWIQHYINTSRFLARGTITG